MNLSSIEPLIIALFWACAGTVVYAYAVYPALVYVLSLAFGRTRVPPEPRTLPRAALLIAAHNEAAVLEERIRNALETDYPAGLFEVVIASDGSDDGTADIAARYANQVRVLLFPRRGKAATLEDAARLIDADVIILSDANTFLEPRAARLLARWFEDPNVGAVCGRLELVDPATGRNADGMYWRYETFLKTCEARLGALLGANGAIYAVRREHLTAIPHGTIIDDFVVPLVAKLRSNVSVLYEPQAVAHEETAPNLKGEFRRRVRIGVGGWRSLATLWPLLSPARGWTAFAFWSHKVLRWACPFMLIGALVSSLALVANPLYAVIFAGQLIFHAVCIAAATAPTATRAMRLCGMFLMMNLALLLGFVAWLRGGQDGTWRRTARS